MEAICPICGVEFEKKGRNQKYCSLICGNINYKNYQKEYQKSKKFKEYHRKYRETEKYRLCIKKQSKRISNELSDKYIKSTLHMLDAPKELIEAKREQIKLFRLIKQMS